MLCSLALVALGASAVPAPAPTTRMLTVAVYTKKAAPVLDLGAQELQISEGGRKRTVLSIEVDRSPMDVAVVLDSSAAVAQAYGRDLVPAVLEYWKALPGGSQVAVWSTAPAKVVDFGTDAATAESRLRSVAVAGGSRAIEAMTDACRALGARSAARRTLVYIGGRSRGASAGDTSALMQAVGQNRVTPMSC
jgi:hypothetical protein